ncbi:MAG: 50S ribosomal protein L20 [Candidatus Bipolaricaulia bacterium]
MPRVKGGKRRKERRKKILKLAKGFKGRRGTAHRIAKQSVMKALRNAYIDRRRRKREFRRMWIIRIGAASRQRGLSYSRFIGDLKAEGIELNRKMLAEIAVRDAKTFDSLAEIAKKS